MKMFSKTILCMFIFQICLFPATQAQQGDNLQYIASQAATILFNIVQNPYDWEASLCPATRGYRTVNYPGYGMDLLTNVVKYIEVLLAVTNYDREWVNYYCNHRQMRISKGHVVKK